jgi:SAM-dependent methyltransferase
LDVLVAGCGTGRHSIELADKFLGARVLAVDLSLASLAYAQRKTPAALASEIEYAQGDLLELASIGRSFDLIDATGVLHHLGKPFEGWRSLLSLLSSGGVMRVGLYSRLARRHIMEARAYLESKGYEASLEDIRRCRQDLLMSPHKDVASAGDFFCTSECRDLLFHAQESQMSIPEVKFFLAQNDLQFIGFELPSQILEVYANAFGANAPTSDLERWHALETRNPAIFAGMYQFFVQRT